ncbi:MAG: FAD-dependent oxidoreductase [Armatimonadetes bacterium]|nr:FAD-dependent oxidoreductase [Armatimonadota bacterium]
MSALGTETHPLRVAVIGSGPTGFFAAEHLLKEKELQAQVDLYEKLPTPYGLVRGGVAPDHQKIKSVTASYERTAENRQFRFFGNVELGRHITVGELMQFYHAVIYCTGAQTDRRMDIPGEDLEGSRTATEFVAWYNGHPDYRDLQFDLSAERVVIVGVGNVAVDVARILCRTPEELRSTDIADYALEALEKSRIREVWMLGRRGPAQAAFTNPEIRELGALDGADLAIDPEDMELDPLSTEELEKNPDRAVTKKLEILRQAAARPPQGKPRALRIRFLVSPVELIGDDHGRVCRMKLVRNVLTRFADGWVSCRHTDRFEEVPVGLVFRSVGYRGMPVPGVPFDDRRGVIPNRNGRVLDGDRVIPGNYAAGWIKRGPSGVIGTNKPCARDTVDALLEDLRAGSLPPPSRALSELEPLLRERTRVVTFQDWKQLDSLEVSRGQALGRPRVKFTRVGDMLEAIAEINSSRPGR